MASKQLLNRMQEYAGYPQSTPSAAVYVFPLAGYLFLLAQVIPTISLVESCFGHGYHTVLSPCIKSD